MARRIIIKVCEKITLRVSRETHEMSKTKDDLRTILHATDCSARPPSLGAWRGFRRLLISAHTFVHNKIKSRKSLQLCCECLDPLRLQTAASIHGYA
jgi:hypothetical protein